MTNKSILVITLMVVALFLSCNKAQAQKANPESDFVVKTIDGDKAVEITKYGGETKSVVIPSKIKGLPVTVIGEEAFSGLNLINVVIPNTVTTIGKEAFSGNKLTVLTIPNSVTIISEYAFYKNELSSLTIPDSITTIGDGAFDDNKLTSITIPKNITAIGNYAFSKNRISSITIPDNITSMGNGAFSENELTSVTIPNSVTKIGVRAFSENPLTSVIIPNSVTEIEASAFRDCNEITSITIGQKVYIGVFAFTWGPNNMSIGFTNAYDKNGKSAGTYTRPNANTGTWTKQ